MKLLSLTVLAACVALSFQLEYENDHFRVFLKKDYDGQVEILEKLGKENAEDFLEKLKFFKMSLKDKLRHLADNEKALFNSFQMFDKMLLEMRNELIQAQKTGEIGTLIIRRINEIESQLPKSLSLFTTLIKPKLAPMIAKMKVLLKNPAMVELVEDAMKISYYLKDNRKGKSVLQKLIAEYLARNGTSAVLDKFDKVMRQESILPLFTQILNGTTDLFDQMIEGLMGTLNTTTGVHVLENVVNVTQPTLMKLFPDVEFKSFKISDVLARSQGYKLSALIAHVKAKFPLVAVFMPMLNSLPTLLSNLGGLKN